MRLPSPRQRDLVLALLAFVLAATTVYLVLVSWRVLNFDVSVYWEAGARMRAGGEELYAPRADPRNTVGDYLYPPLLACLFAPLTWLPRPVGTAVWGALQLGVALWAAVALARLCGLRSGRATRDLALMLLVGCFAAVWVNLTEGQINLLVVACVASGLALIEDDRPLLGGGLLAAAAHLKVLPVVLVGVLLAQRRWRALGGVALGGALLLAAPLPWTVADQGLAGGIARTIDLDRQWVEQRLGPGLASQDADTLGMRWLAPNNSLSAVTHRWFGQDHRLSTRSGDRSPILTALPEPSIRWSGFLAATLLYLGALWLAWRTREGSRRSRAAAAGLALMAAALGNVLLWTHHLCLLTLVLAPLFAQGLEGREGRRSAAWVLTLTVALTFVPAIEQVPLFDRMAVLGAPTLGVLIAGGVTFVAFSSQRSTDPQTGATRGG